MTYPTKQFCELIPQIEDDLARSCLGFDLYEYLTSVLNPYPTGVNEYNPAQTYNVDDKVIRNGCLFVSESNGNTTDPLQETGDWAIFEKFTDDEANELWERYLRRIIALKVYTSSLTLTTWLSGAGGITVNTGDSVGNRSASRTELFDLKKGLMNMTEIATSNMLTWFKRNKATIVNLPLPPQCETAHCETKGKHSRRWAFAQ